MTQQMLIANFLRAQAAWRLARAGDDPVGAARCAAALLDTAAFVAALADDDHDLARLALGGCFHGDVFDPGPTGVTIARGWQYGDIRQAGPRDLMAALATAANGRQRGLRDRRGGLWSRPRIPPCGPGQGFWPGSPGRVSFR